MGAGEEGVLRAAGDLEVGMKRWALGEGRRGWPGVQAIYPKALPALARVVAKAPKFIEIITVLKILIIVLR
jgi:hypothetical protein